MVQNFNIQGGPIKCYHFLNPCYFQNRFFLFSKILTTKHWILTPMDRKQYTVKERVKIVEAYFELKLITQTQWQFVIDVPERNPPCILTIRHLLRKFRKTGYATKANKGHSGRPRSARTAINTEIVRQRLEESPRKSTRCLSEGDCPLKDHSQTHTEHRSLFLSLQSSDFTNSLILNVGLMFLITNLWIKILNKFTFENLGMIEKW